MSNIYKYKIGDKITVIIDKKNINKKHKERFCYQNGKITYIYYTSENPYDIDFDDKSLNGYYCFNEDEICLQGKEDEINNLETGIDLTKLSKKEIEVYKIANNVLYFNDRSNYKTALYEILRILNPELEDYPTLKYIE